MKIIAQEISSYIIDSLLLGREVDVAAAPSFLEAGIIDSTGILELVQFVEEKWGLVVKDEEMVPENLDSLERIVRFVEDKVESAPTVPCFLSAAE